MDYAMQQAYGLGSGQNAMTPMMPRQLTLSEQVRERIATAEGQLANLRKLEAMLATHPELEEFTNLLATALRG